MPSANHRSALQALAGEETLKGGDLAITPSMEVVGVQEVRGGKATVHKTARPEDYEKPFKMKVDDLIRLTPQRADACIEYLNMKIHAIKEAKLYCGGNL
jgi:hypothetical protein